MTRRIVSIAFSLVLFAAIQNPIASATSLDPTMMVTVKGGAVELPGTVLQPGKYEFSFADAYRQVVEVQAADGSRVIGYFMVIPQERQHHIGQARVDVSHRPGSPERIKDLYFMGDVTGYKFLYSKAKPAVTAGPMLQR